MWDINNKKLLRTFCPLNSKNETYTVTNDFKTLITADTTCTIKLWDINTGLIKFQKSLGYLTNFIVSPDNQFLVTIYPNLAENKVYLRIYDLNTLSLQKQINFENGSDNIIFTPDSKYIIYSSISTIYIVDVNTCIIIDSINNDFVTPYILNISDDGNFLIVGDHDGQYEIYNLKTKKWENIINLTYNKINHVHISPDNKYIAVNDFILDADNGNFITQFPESFDAENLVFSYDNKYILFSMWNKVILWNYLSQNNDTTVIMNNANSISCIDISPDGKYLAIASDYNSICLFDLSTRKIISESLKYNKKIYKIFFSDDGKNVFGICGGEDFFDDYEIINWDLVNKQFYVQPTYYLGSVSQNMVAVSGNRRYVATSTGMLDFNKNFETVYYGGSNIQNGQFLSYDGSLLSMLNPCSDDDNICVTRLYNPFTQKFKASYNMDDYIDYIDKPSKLSLDKVTSVAISNDSKFFIVGTEYGKLARFDLPDSITSVTENNYNNKLNINPNPANTTFRFSFNSITTSQFQISIFNYLGNEVYSMNEHSTEGLNEKTINVSSLPSGYYIVRLRHSGTVETAPLLILK